MLYIYKVKKFNDNGACIVSEFIFMLDLTQNKLTKEEWVSIEVPIPSDEKHIVQLICNGYEDVNICQNKTLSLMGFLRIPITNGTHAHIFKRYIEPKLNEIVKKYNLKIKKFKKDKEVLKKKDKLRLENADKNMRKIKIELFEFVLIDLLSKLHAAKKI